MPALAPQRDEADPLRAVRQQRMATEVIREQPLAVFDALLLRRAVQARPPPCVLRALDDERRPLAVERVRVDLEQAVRVLAKDEREGVEDEVRAEPDETGSMHVLRGME